MKGPEGNNQFSLWKKIKETDTFKKLEEDVKAMTDGFKDDQNQDMSTEPSESTFETANTESTNEPVRQSEINAIESDSGSDDRKKDEESIDNEQLDQSDSRASRKEQNDVKSKAILFGKKFLHFFDIGYGVVKSLIIFFIVLLVLGVAFVGGTGAGYFASLVHGREIPPYPEMESEVTTVTSKSTIYYGTGEVLSDLRSDLKRTPISIEDMSPNVLNAMIATEDEYFMEHEGIVPKAIARALFQEFSGAEMTSGGSTLTQQLVKQQILTNETSFERKANEIMLAMRLEDTMEKDEILEAYMNVSPFGRNNKGENIAGIQEAARGIFGVDASELTVPQAAFLAGLPQSPIAYSPYNQYGEIREDHSAGLNRQRNVLFFMYREGYLTETEYEEARNYDITQDFISSENLERNDQSFLYDSVAEEARNILLELAVAEDGLTMADLNENEELYEQYWNEADQDLRVGGYNIQTTVHKNLHETMEQVAHEHRNDLGAPRDVTWTNSETGEESHWVENVENGSVLLDNASGRILGFVGGVDYESNQNNHALDRRRQPASTLKPLIVYGPALELGLITPATLIMDSEVEVPHWENGRLSTHTPRNVGPTTNQWMTAREALSVSQNIPATKIFMGMYNDYDLKPFLRNAGFGPEAFPDEVFSYPSLAIGGAGNTTVLEMVSAFSSIANSGDHVDPFLIERIETKDGELVFEHEQATTEVYSPKTAFLLQDMLRDTVDTGTARGIEDRLNFSADIISKTGTSNDYHDIWYLASTPQVTLGSWIGYDTPADLRVGHSRHPSIRNRYFWAELMNAVYEVNPTIVGTDLAFQQPEGVVEESVLASTGMKPGRVELPGGSTTNISGSTVTEYFNNEFVPGTTTYDFSIMATDEELATFWGRQRRSQSENEGDDNEENNEEESDEQSSDSENNNEEASSEENNDESNNENEENAEPSDSENEESEEEPQEDEEDAE